MLSVERVNILCLALGGRYAGRYLKEAGAANKRREHRSARLIRKNNLSYPPRYKWPLGLHEI